MYPHVSLVIPTWNGLHLLRQNLPSVLEAANYYEEISGAETEVILVDDGSQDGTPQIAQKEFPNVEVITRSRNGGFAAACNTGFEHCQFSVIALLNNDVRIQRDYLVHQAEHFRDSRIFAVTAKVFEWNSRLFATGGRYGRFRRGFWSVYFNYDVSMHQSMDWIRDHRLLSFYAIGGFATYDGEKLKQLGGFNELLSPFHWEDVDLSYRAWKRGWKVHYEPRSVGYHRASSTIGAHYRDRNVDAISFRNRLLFHWINLHSPSLFVRHLLGLGLLCLTRIFVLDLFFYRSLAQALRRLPEVHRLRKVERSQARCTDVEIQSILTEFYRSAPIQIYYNQRDVMSKHPDYLAASDSSDLQP
ncbi:MAG TPA: glycosyltransferase [Acidobacteriota bacterium]|nr:glycosyltransferase [Acidobacteriota bacterium]